jgi:MATE family multidrug resistance protein
MRASTMVLVVVFPINVAVSIALIHHTPLGLLGSPLALSVTYWLSFGLLALYTTFSPTHRRNGTWGGIDIKAVLDLNSCVIFLKLALPGILMVGTEWYVLPNYTMVKGGNDQTCRAAFEIVALAAGRLGELPLAAQSVIMTTDQSKIMSECWMDILIIGCSS